VTHHADIYEQARAYDVAFSFRDYAKECDFLLELARRYGRHEASRFLELAAGPANHAREMARRGLDTVALDRSPGMAAYGRARATSEGVSLEYVEADMEDFALARDFDLAACMIVSWSYLLDNAAVLAHLDRVAEHLADGGVYVVELSHPRDLLTTRRSTGNVWTQERDGVRVSTRWGLPDDPFDPVTQVRRVTVEIDVEDEHGTRSWRDVAPQREFGPNEVQALVAANGRFEIAALLGALDADQPLDDDEASWRMIPVLRRV